MSEDALKKIRASGGHVQRVSASGPQWEVHFHLSGKELRDEQLAHVAELGGVVSLNLKGTSITDAGLARLKALAQLQKLHLEQTAIGDEGVAHLAKLTNLEYLNLYGTNVTDRALQSLTGLTNLRSLYLWQTGVSDEGVAKLQAALPELEIVRGADLSKLPAPPPKVPLVDLKWNPTGGDKPPISKTGSAMTVLFENRSGQKVKLYWIAYNGEQTLYHEIDAGADREQGTYSEATWLVTDLEDKPLGHFRTGGQNARAVIPKE